MKVMHGPAFALILLAAGCGSSPKTHFFTLNPVTAVRTTIASAPLQVVAVHIPAMLDRQEMVRRMSGGTLDISNQNRWSAPLGVMVRRVLTQNLAARLPEGRVVYPQEPAPKHTERLVVDILRFSPDGAGDVVLVASWTLLPGDSNTPLITQHVRLSHVAGGLDYSGQVGAMSAILGELADRIVAALPAKH